MDIIMKKTVLAIAMGGLMASNVANAAEIEVRDAYLGAEIGGNFLLGEEDFQTDGTFASDNMFKVGAEIGTKMTKDVDVFIATEARLGMEGIDKDWTEGKYDGDTTDLYKFTIGADTVAGRTEFGILEGEADNIDGFADLSMEHGLNAYFDAAINGENTLQHIYKNDMLQASASYDFDTESYFLGATAKVLPNLEIGAGYVDGGKHVDEIETDRSYTLGAVYSLQKLDLAAKYASVENVDGHEVTGYALSTAYKLNDKLKLAASYNKEDYDLVGAPDFDDDWFTVGASYQVHKNIELVTDYKFASEEDDQLFVRANVNF
tara:strand:+ start:45071 stop:46027 length:957 start_codon:yes stop_codon:yes gene_type:complete